MGLYDKVQPDELVTIRIFISDFFISVPGAVSELSVGEKDSSSAGILWSPPEHPNGILTSKYKT